MGAPTPIPGMPKGPPPAAGELVTVVAASKAGVDRTLAWLDRASDGSGRALMLCSLLNNCSDPKIWHLSRHSKADIVHDPLRCVCEGQPRCVVCENLRPGCECMK